MDTTKQKRINLYNCKTCGNTIITEDKDEGVTPMFLPCEMFGGCSDGKMVSMMYNVPPILIAGYEWYNDGGEALNIRKIKELRDPQNYYDERFNHLKKINSENKSSSGCTSLHKQFRKGKKP